jgi:vitamin B12 transporter
MMRAVYFTFLAGIVMSAQLHSGEIRGRVLDPSGAAVPEASVSAIQQTSNVQFTTLADRDGAYVIQGIAAGEWLIDAQAPGFGASAVARARVDGAAPLVLDLTLQLQRVSSQVQITAAGAAQTVDEQAKALTIIDNQQVSDREEFSVAEAIRNVPGIRVQQLGGPGSLVRVISRGMRSHDTSLLIDGFRMRDAGAPQGDATAFLGDLVLVDTDRIAVLRGSGSSLYGTHATGGVINVITSTGDSNTHGEITAEGGGLGLFRGLAKVGGSALRDSKLRYTLGAAHLNLTSGIDGNDRLRNSTLHGLLQYRFGSATEVSGRVIANNGFSQLNDTPYAITPVPPGDVVRAIPYVTFIPGPDDPDTRRSSGYLSGLFSLSQTWSPAASTRLSYQGVTTRRDNRDGPGGVEFEPEYTTSDRFDGRLDTLQARTDFHIRNSWITAGYEWERETFDNRSHNEYAPPALQYNARLQINQSSHSVFAQEQLQLLDRRLQISFSGRVQAFQLSQPRFSDNTSVYQGVTLQSPPRALTGDTALAYFLRTSGTKFRAHLGNGYRSPSLYERFGGSYFGGFSVFGDPRLSPERLLAVDAGVDQYLGSRARVSATYFYTRIQQAIVFDFTGAITPETDPYGRFGGYRNTGGGLARGVELSIETNPIRNLTLRSSYTYTNADERNSIFSTGNLRTLRVSDHMFAVTATQRIGRPLDITFDMFAASNYLLNFGTRAFSFDGPVKADIAINYTRSLTDTTSLRLFTRIDNVFNRTYYEDGFRTPKAWATAGIKFLF